MDVCILVAGFTLRATEIITAQTYVIRAHALLTQTFEAFCVHFSFDIFIQSASATES